MGGACSTDERDEKCLQIFLLETEERRPRIGSRTILDFLSIWLRIGADGRLL
jgi:hypothetical protein